MRALHDKSEYTGSREGNPDSRVGSSDLWRRPSTELEPVATSGGSVRNDRSNKSRSPRANAPAAERASRHHLPVAMRRERNSLYSLSEGPLHYPCESGESRNPEVRGNKVRDAKRVVPNPSDVSCIPPSKGRIRGKRNSFSFPLQEEIRRGARSGCLAKGRVSGREFGRRRTLFAEGRGYGTRMCKTTRWDATALKLKVATRAHGLATWAVTGSGKLAVQHLAQSGDA